MKRLLNISMLMMIASFSWSQVYLGGEEYPVDVRSSASAPESGPEKTLDRTGMDAELMEAARFLSQAAFGARLEEIQEVKESGFENWIDQQFQLPASYLTEEMWHNWDRIVESYEDYFNNYLAETLIYRQMSARQINPDSIAPPLSEQEVDEMRERYLDELYGPYSLHFNNIWWHRIMTAEDQLRHKMAYALSQIFVVSSNSDLTDDAEGLTYFYDILLEHAFGNFRDLLEDVTYSPAMGFYLSHLNNPKAVPEQNIHPDENYAREIMQLFTIGLYELNLDGTRKTDAQGNNIPTYNNADIKELARVFTGLGPGALDRRMYEDGIIDWTDEPYFGLDLYAMSKEDPMVMYGEWHDTGAKSLLNGLELPPNQPGVADIHKALDFLFMHDNTGPFISRQLIQRFVTSNPSPNYVARVASVFNDDGNGNRGNLGAVLKAILLDTEARDCGSVQEMASGKLSEPLLRHIFISRMAELVPYYYYEEVSFTSYDSAGIVVRMIDEYADPASTTVDYWNNGYEDSDALKQYALMAPTVFNFYLPDHQPVGDFASMGLFAPEFKIHDSSTAINYLNSVWNYVGNPWWNYLWFNWEDRFTQIEPSYERYTEIYEEQGLEHLIHHLDIEFTRGLMSDELRDILRQFERDVPEWVESDMIAKYVMYLILISPDFTINK